MPTKGSSGERNGVGGCAFRQRLSQNGECPASLFRRLAAQAAPWGPRSPSALQSPPLSQPWGQPRLLPRRGWEKMAQTFWGGEQKSPQQLVEGNGFVLYLHYDGGDITFCVYQNLQNCILKKKRWILLFVNYSSINLIPKNATYDNKINSYCLEKKNE